MMLKIRLAVAMAEAEPICLAEATSESCAIQVRREEYVE